MTPSVPVTMAVVGTGLIGTSIALAARAAGVRVLLADRDDEALAVAVGLGAGERAVPGGPPVDLAVLAVPPDAVPSVLRAARDRGLARVYTDIASTKATIVRSSGAVADFVPGHPMAGGETSGPRFADAALFQGATWVLCPQRGTDAEAVDVVRWLVRACGARPVDMDAEAHDRAVALVSHAPHLVASAMAAALRGADPDALRLAGRGVRDTTRIAAGDPELWTDILRHNAEHVARYLVVVATELSHAAIALTGVARGDHAALAEVTDLLVRGCAGRAALTDDSTSAR